MPLIQQGLLSAEKPFTLQEKLGLTCMIIKVLLRLLSPEQSLGSQILSVPTRTIICLDVRNQMSVASSIVCSGKKLVQM